MFHTTRLAALFVAALAPGIVAAEDKPTIDLAGSLDDAALQKSAPESGVIVSTKAWDALVKAWNLGDKLPKVDFDKELIAVATTVGSRLKFDPQVKDGDLKVLGLASRDFRPGFRYAIKSVKKEGVKTVNGKELPKE